jgi:membrane protease YdiL (CAAX protease family)
MTMSDGLVRIRLGPVGGFLAGWAIFAAAVGAIHAATRLGWLQGAVSSHNWLKTLLLAVSLAFMLADRRPWRAFGFRLPRASWPHWLAAVAGGGLFGACAAVLVLATPAGGIPWLRDFSFPELVLGIWLYSTLAEEVFVRGLVQTWMEKGSPRTPGGRRTRTGGAVLASGLLFGSMHLSILWKGGDGPTAAIIVSCTCLLGLLAAWLRQRTGSLVLPLLAHLAFNLGGVAGGVAWMLLARSQ